MMLKNKLKKSSNFTVCSRINIWFFKLLLAMNSAQLKAPPKASRMLQHVHRIADFPSSKVISKLSRVASTIHYQQKLLVCTTRVYDNKTTI